MSDRRVWVLAFLVLSALGSLWAVGVPAGGQPDEPAHLTKAAAVVRGQFGWLSREDHNGATPGEITVTELIIESPNAYWKLGEANACAIRPPVQPQSCAEPMTHDTAVGTTSNYVAAYPPLAYLLFGWPTLVFRPDRALIAARLCSVALCAAFLALAFVSARRSDRAGMFVGGVALATTPGVIFFASATNPNGLEIATAICLTASLVDLLTRPVSGSSRSAIDWRAVAPVVLSASVLAVTRPASLAVLGVVAGSVSLCVATRPRWRALASSNAGRGGAAIVAASVAAGAAWFVYARPLDTVVGVAQPEMPLSEMIRHSLSLFPRRGQEMVGVFGWGDTLPPAWVLIGWMVLVAVLVVFALAVGRWRHRFVLVGLIGLNLAIPTIAEVPRADLLGYIWQGRYSMPFAVTVPILAGWVASQRVSVPAVGRRVLAGAVVGVAGFIALAMFVSVMMTLTRFATGSTAPSVFGFLDELSWQPVGGGWLYVVVGALAAAAYGALLVRLTLRRAVG